MAGLTLSKRKGFRLENLMQLRLLSSNKRLLNKLRINSFNHGIFFGLFE